MHLWVPFMPRWDDNSYVTLHKNCVGYEMQKTWCCTAFWVKESKRAAGDGACKSPAYVQSGLCNPPLIFTAVHIFAWSCSKWNYSFLISCLLLFTYLWASLWTFPDNLLFRISEQSPNGSCWSKCQSAAWDTFGASQPKGSPWQELSISSGACPGEALPEFNERSRCRTSQSQQNLPAACNCCYAFCHWVGESDNLRWRKWQCPHQGGSLEHDMPSVWVASCQTQWAEPQQPPPAPGQLRQPEAAQAQVTTAGNASCPADKRYHFNYTNSSSRAAAGIILGSHGLRLKHHLITLMNCSLTLCLTLSSQRELPAQHLLSQRTHGRARSSHLSLTAAPVVLP